MWNNKETYISIINLFPPSRKICIFKQNLWNNKETYISIINLFPPSRKICISRMVQPCRKLYTMYVACIIYRLIGVHLWHFHITCQTYICVGLSLSVSCSVYVLYYPSQGQSPGKFEWNFRYVISIWILRTDGWGITCEIALIWMSLDFTDDQSTLVQATIHFFKQFLPRSQCHMVSPDQNELTDVMALVLEDIRYNILYFATSVESGQNMKTRLKTCNFDAQRIISM